MKKIKAFYGGWTVVTDEQAEKLVNHLYKGALAKTSKDEIRNNHVRDTEDANDKLSHKEVENESL